MFSVNFNLATYRRANRAFRGASCRVQRAPRVYVSGGFAGSTVKGSTGGRVGVAFGFGAGERSGSASRPEPLHPSRSPPFTCTEETYHALPSVVLSSSRPLRAGGGDADAESEAQQAPRNQTWADTVSGIYEVFGGCRQPAADRNRT